MDHATGTCGTTGITQLLQVIVDRSPLDTFDLWTRYEALPRLRRRSLLGDTAAVGRSSGTRPGFTPSAVTVVEGQDGYAATVWIRSLDGSSSIVSLAVDDPAHTEHAAQDLARYVEFALIDAMELALTNCDGVCGCTGQSLSVASASADPFGRSVCARLRPGIDSVAPSTTGETDGTTATAG